jgi:hypothetical protein
MNPVLEDLILKVQNNTTLRTDCPFCRGSHSFSITKTHNVIKYHCFRVSCNPGERSGVIETAPDKTSVEERLRLMTFLNDSKSHLDFTLPDYVIKGLGSKKCVEYLEKNNAIEAYNKGLYSVAYDPKEDRILFLLKDHDSRLAGAVGRTLTYGFPKTLIYPNSRPVPFIAGNSQVAVIVEDCASAAAIAAIDDYTGFALLGTFLKKDYFPYLDNYKTYIVALDPDAKKKSLDIAYQLSYLGRRVKKWFIPRDLKNMTKAEIKDFISSND